MNRAKTDGFVREIVGLSACFQSVNGSKLGNEGSVPRTDP